jgi:hypothetical protein
MPNQNGAMTTLLSGAKFGPTKTELRRAILENHQLASAKDVLGSISWRSMHGNTQSALKDLLSGQRRLKDRYRDHLAERSKDAEKHKMTFAFDGRLVGDIGELIAAEIFPLDLLGTKSPGIDARTEGAPHKGVQIKATFGTGGLAVKNSADHYIGIQLCDTGRFRIVYNGLAAQAVEYLKLPKSAGQGGRREAGNRLELISLEAWAVLNLNVAPDDRLPFRANSNAA